MQAPYIETARPSSPAPDRGVGVARLLTVTYFCACSLHGLIHLRLAGASAETLPATLRLWYAEAIVFGALWGLAALVHGLVKGGGGDRAPRRREAAQSGGVLRALERDRGR